MVRRAVRVLLFAALCLVPVAMYAQGDYLDIYIVRVKPDKIADFNVLAKKMVDANQHNNGDHWLAQYVMYGENDTFVFASMRQDYADVDKGSNAFMSALNKAYGKDAADKLTRDWNSCLISSRTELRKRRPDLSRKFPADMAAYAKLIGTSKVLRSSVIHIRPGHGPEFEALLKETQAVAAKAENTQPLLVSQSVEGNEGTTYYITALRSGLEGFDKNPTTREILGDEGFKKFLQGVSDTVESSESMILHFAPELSNPPEEILAAAPDFWQPKPVVASKAKPKSSGEKAAAEKPKQ